MKEVIFPYRNNSIKIYLEKINRGLLDDIDLLVKTFDFELNRIEPESSAYKFNNSQPNIPIPLKTEFLNFLDLNKNYYLRFAGKFNPFSEQGRADASKLIIADHDTNHVIKVAGIKFNTSMLSTAFILSSIDKLFTEYKAKTRLIKSSKLFVANGNREWDIGVPGFPQFKMKVSNESVFLYSPKKQEGARTIPKFGNVDNLVSPEMIILEGKNLLNLKVISSIIPFPAYSEDYRLFAQNYGIGLTLLSGDGEVIEFKRQEGKEGTYNSLTPNFS